MGAFVAIVAIGHHPPSLQTPIASTCHPSPLARDGLAMCLVLAAMVL